MTVCFPSKKINFINYFRKNVNASMIRLNNKIDCTEAITKLMLPIRIASADLESLKTVINPLVKEG